MLALRGRSSLRFDAPPYVSRVTTDPERPRAVRIKEVLLTDCTPYVVTGFAGVMQREPAGKSTVNVLELPSCLDYLGDGDILRCRPTTGEIDVMYRRRSNSNTFLLNESCNNACLMCSQPPRSSPDYVDDVLAAIELVDPCTRELGLSGGEPSLLGDRLIAVLKKLRNYLPDTAVHLLSNAREFRFLRFAKAVAEVRNTDLVIGIPLHGDTSDLHDYIAQSEDAFDDALRGVMNLARCKVRVEIRVVIHKLNCCRLRETARFISRNLAFASHIAFMGMETCGLAKAHLDELWVDAADYGDELAQAVGLLCHQRFRVSVFNHPLCILPQSVWPFARQSISDWKVEFSPECLSCSAKRECCGMFGTSHRAFSKRISALSEADMAKASMTCPHSLYQ